MKIHRILPAAMLFVATNAGAQAYLPSGNIKDTKGNAVAYASVALLKTDTVTLAGGTMSGSAGEFAFEGVPDGEYVVSVSLIGYKPCKKPVRLSAGAAKGLDIVLEEKDMALGTVTVKGNRGNTVRRSASGQTFMLSAAAAEKKDAYSALQEIPVLQIDPDTRKITLNNGGQPLVLINGVRREGGLASVNPEDILSVDVAQTASAEFMREGYTSVINIKVRPGTGRYTMFNAGVNAHPLLRYGLADASFETGDARSSFYVNAQSFAFLNNKSDMLERTQTANSLRELATRRNSHYNDTYVAAGGDRTWSKADYSSFSLTFDYIPQSTKAKGQDMLTDIASGVETPYDHFRKFDDKSYTGSANLYHKHTFDNKSALDMLLTFNLGKNTNRVDQTETAASGASTLSYDYRNKRFGMSFAPAYKFSLAGLDTKVGLNTYYQDNSIRQAGTASSAFKHREWDEYLYADVSRAWGGFSLAASVGVDAVFRSIDGYSSHFWNFLPAVNAGYSFSESHSLLLSYNMQSYAPGILQLNPYNTSSDTLTVATGNPSLRPYRVHTARLAYTFTSRHLYIEPELAFRHTENAIVSSGEDFGVLYRTRPVNRGSRNLLTAGANMRYSFGKWGYLGLAAYYNHSEFPSNGRKDDYVSGRVYGGVNYRRFAFNFNYWLPVRTYDMWSRSYSSPESNATLTFSPSRSWDITAGMRFIAWPKHIERWTEMPGYSYYYENKFTNRGSIAMIGFRYKFQNRGKAKREQKKLRNSDKGFRLISE